MLSLRVWARDALARLPPPPPSLSLIQCTNMSIWILLVLLCTRLNNNSPNWLYHFHYRGCCCCCRGCRCRRRYCCYCYSNLMSFILFVCCLLVHANQMHIHKPHRWMDIVDAFQKSANNSNTDDAANARAHQFPNNCVVLALSLQFLFCKHKIRTPFIGYRIILICRSPLDESFVENRWRRLQTEPIERTKNEYFN